MKTNTTPFTRNWASASFASSLRLKSLGLAVLTSLTLLAPAASGALSLTPTQDEPECVVMSGSWSWDSGSFGVSRNDFWRDVVVGWSSELGVVDLGGVLDYYFELVGPAGDYSSSFELIFNGDFRRFGGDLTSSGVVGSYGYDLSVLYTPSAVQGTGTWSGSYRVWDLECEPNRSVPDSGGALALFACGLGAVGGVRRLLAKRQRA